MGKRQYNKLDGVVRETPITQISRRRFSFCGDSRLRWYGHPDVLLCAWANCYYSCCRKPI